MVMVSCVAVVLDFYILAVHEVKKWSFRPPRFMILRLLNGIALDAQSLHAICPDDTITERLYRIVFKADVSVE